MNYIRIISTLFILLSTQLSFAQTQHQLDSMERLVPKKKGEEKVRLLNDLSYYYCQKDANKAIKFGEQSLVIAQKLKNETLLASTYNDLSIPYLVNGDFPKVVVLNRKALAIRTRLKDTIGIIASESKLGNAYYELARYKEAQEAYDHAIELARKSKEGEKYLIQLYANSANLLEVTGFVKEALKLHLDILKMATEEQNTGILITTYGNLGSCYRKLKQFDKSREMYKAAIPLVKKAEAHEQLGMVYQGLGVLEREAGNTDLGLSYYRKALRIYEQVGSKTGAGIVSVNIGKSFMSIKQLDSAEVYLLKGLDLVKNTRSFRQTMLAYQGLADLELKRKDFQSATNYLRLENQYKDSMAIYQGNEVLAEMFARYEVERKERELAESKVRIAENQSEKAIWFGVSACLFLLIVLVIIYFRHKRKLAIHQLAQTKQEEQLLRQKQLHEQKLDISRELHDNIGSQLTYLISSMDHMIYQEKANVQLHEKLRELMAFGRTTMGELRSTVWAMNAENGNVSDFIDRIESLGAKSPIPFTVNRETSSEITFKSLELLNLYRIVQEATQNTLKYASATEIEVNISELNGVLTLEIKDNGNGMAASTKDGNGMRTMKHRCEEIGGKFEVESNPGTGTTVRCSFPDFTQE